MLSSTCVYVLRAKICSTLATLASFPPDEMVLSVLVPIRMSVCPRSQRGHHMGVQTHGNSRRSHLVHCGVTLPNDSHDVVPWSLYVRTVPM